MFTLMMIGSLVALVIGWKLGYVSIHASMAPFQLFHFCMEVDKTSPYLLVVLNVLSIELALAFPGSILPGRRMIFKSGPRSFVSALDGWWWFVLALHLTVTAIWLHHKVQLSYPRTFWGMVIIFELILIGYGIYRFQLVKSNEHVV